MNMQLSQFRRTTLAQTAALIAGAVMTFNALVFMQIGDRSSVDRVESGLDQVDAFVVGHHLQCPLEEGPGRARNGT